jgi:hypothetical protein
MRRIVNLLALVVTLGVAASSVSSAAPATYYITVAVTSAPNSPGTFVPWTFAGLPAVFQGTFVADDTIPGPISSLVLIVGGVNILATHPIVVENAFDPGTKLLNFVTFGLPSAVGFGASGGPANYALGADTTGIGPRDPYFGGTTFQNWVGTFAVTTTPVRSSPVQTLYATHLDVGDAFINLTNAGVNGAGLFYGTTANVNGAICANVYAFSTDEQLVACCSCPVTPNALASLSVRNDLLNNILSQQSIPTSLHITLTATVPVDASCNGSAFAATTLIGGSVSSAPGLTAWGATLHANTSVTPAKFSMTENPFQSNVLSPQEAGRLQQLCMFVNANGSGFGICNSCRPGGLSAEKK